MVHRSTRGWSYGSSVSDPRTGEIIKGHVSLGSLRVRQDRLIFEGLLGTDKTGSGEPDDPIELSLARIRQLSAHEVGHTIGLSHNFAASTYHRGSVMDYPAPDVRVTDGKIDVSDVYGVGIGAYDIQAIRWLYKEYENPTQERVESEAIVRSMNNDGLLFLSDSDARSPGASDPRANLWDNGSDAVEGLKTTMAVREIALNKFGRHNLMPNEPLSTIQEVLVPIYLFHRYQIDAAAKTLGGVEYEHVLNSDGRRPFKVVSASRQREALDTLLECLEPSFLDLPSNVTDLIGPRPFGIGGNRELFSTSTSPTFDEQAAVGSAAQIVLNGLLNGTRLTRLAQQKDIDADLPDAKEVLGEITRRVFRTAERGQPEPETIWTVRKLYTTRLMGLASAASLPTSVSGSAQMELERIRELLAPGDPNHEYLAKEIERFIFRPAGTVYPLPSPPEVPPGSPIGCSHYLSGE